MRTRLLPLRSQSFLRPLRIAFSAGLVVVLVLASAPSTADGPTPPDPRYRTAMLAFTGDLLPHLPVVKFARYYARVPHFPGSIASIIQPPEMYATWETRADRQYDFAPMFEQVAPELRAADLAICHLESTISSQAPRGYPRFRTPPELVEAIAQSGWDGCSLASNHSMDYGVDGVSQTIEAMAANHLESAGTSLDEQSRGAAHYQVNGIRIAHLSYTYGLNGFRLPKNQQWWVNLIDVDIIQADAAAARAEGAEFIIASLHWGSEYQPMPTYHQKRTAKEIAATGAVDLLVGHHAHVIQPIDRIGDLWVVYGLGNFLSNQPWPRSRDGAILHVEIGDTPEGVMVKSISYTPTWVDRPRMQVVALANRLLDPDLDSGHRVTLRQSWSRTVRAFEAMGAQYPWVKPAVSPP